jgi:hypothetical protein
MAIINNVTEGSAHPRIGGTWENAVEKFDPAKHRIGFGFQVLKPSRDLAERIEVLIEGVADTSGFTAEVTDAITEAVNESLTPSCGCTSYLRRTLATGAGERSSGGEHSGEDYRDHPRAPCGAVEGRGGNPVYRVR